MWAAGLELDVSVRPRRRPIDRLTGPVGRRVRRHRKRLVDVAAVHGLTRLRVFGSVARGEDRDDSDLDLLVGLDQPLGVVALGRARQALEDVVGATIDLVPETGLKPDVAARIESDLIKL